MADAHGRDPLEELARLGSDLGTPGGPMTHSAADARRRGDRLRRRRTALVAGGAALAVAAVAVPIGLLADDGTSRADRDLVAPEPDVVTEAALLTDDQTVYSDGADWFTTDSPDPAARAALDVCGRQDLAALGATSVLQRDFEMRNTADPDVEVSGDLLRHTVAGFADEEQALAAYTEVLGWLEDCSQSATAQGLDEQRYLQTYDVDVSAAGPGATGAIVDQHLGPLPPELEDGVSAYIAETGLALVGNRITVVDSVIVGQDYNFLPEEGGTPVNRMLPVAAGLLTGVAEGGAETDPPASPDSADPDDPTDPTDTADPVGPVLPSGFDIRAGWDFDTASYDVPEPASVGPGLLDAAEDGPCYGEESPATAGVSDRLTARVFGPTQSYGREVRLFPTAEEAQSALETVVRPFEECGLDATLSTTTFGVSADDVGDESWRIVKQTAYAEDVLEEGLVTESTQVWWAARVGSALLVMTGLEEGGGTPAASNALLDGLVADAEPVISALRSLD